MFNLFETIAERKEKPFYRYLDDKDNTCEITYDGYASDIIEAFNSLNRMFGDMRGRHIGVLTNRPYDSMVLLAAAFLGKAVVVPINQYESAENIEYIIDNADIEILVVSDAYLKYHAEYTVNVSELITGSGNEKFEYDKTMDEPSDDSYFIIYTSGTTGKSKGVVLPLNNITTLMVANIDSLTDLVNNVSTLYLTVPLYHVMGLYYWLASIYAGFIIYTNQNAGNMIHDLRIIHPGFIVAAPAFIKMIEVYIKRGTKEEVKTLKYIISGGAQLSKGLTERLLEFGVECLDGYGMTETGAGGTFNTDAIAHPDSIGTPMPGVDVIIIDGEMCIKSSSNMKGYYKDEKATAECMIDGVIHTGDLAYIDEDGFVYITGRKKNLIILSGGENVSPEELEKKLSADQNIKECMVFEKNDRICAGIFADAEFQDEIKDFISKLNSTLPIFKRISSIEFRDKEFEKTVNGKIKR